MNDEPVERLDLLPALVRYLDHSGNLANIKLALETSNLAAPHQEQSLNDSFSSFSSAAGPSLPQLTLTPCIQVSEMCEMCLNLAKFVNKRVIGKLLVEGSHTLNAVFRHDEATLLQLGSDYSIVFTLGHEGHGSSRHTILEVTFSLEKV